MRLNPPKNKILLHHNRRHFSSVLLALLFQFTAADDARSAAPVALNGIKTPADLAVAILAAARKKPHVEHVIATLDKAPGTYTKTNTAPAELKQALGGEVSLFDTLKMVNLGSAALGIKGKRETDPFDQAFYEHLGHISDLESLTLSNGKTLTDVDLKTVAGMTHLEHLELGGLPLPPERLPVLKQFVFLKSMRLVPPYATEVQASIKEMLPKVALRFE